VSFQSAMEREFDRFYERLDEAAADNGLTDQETYDAISSWAGRRTAEAWREWATEATTTGVRER
jgi:hypothetical protein